MYVYGVMRADHRLRLPSEGVAGRGVSCVTHDDLAALVSDVPDEPVRSSRRNVMAHSTVLQEVVARADVLPMRFGVLMPGAEAVREELLAAHADTLRSELKALSGCVELDVTVLCRQDVQLRAVLAADPRLRALADRLDAAGMQERIAFGEQVAAAVEDQRARVADQTLDQLGPAIVDAIVDEPRHEDVLTGVACLVERRRMEAFELAVERLGGELGEELRVRCVGPLPPYHFVDIGLAQEVGAWG
jgi:hypothetical protein